MAHPEPSHALTPEAQEALKRVTSLPREQYELVTQELLRREDEEDLDDEWVERMQGRLARLRSGEAKLVPGEEARERLRRHFQQKK